MKAKKKTKAIRGSLRRRVSRSATLKDLVAAAYAAGAVIHIGLEPIEKGK